jgi:hypothetical protein
MSVQPSTPESSASAIPIHVVEAYTHELFKCLKHLKKHVGFMCLGKGTVTDVEKSVKRINDQIRVTAQSCKLAGDYLTVTDGSQSLLVGHGEKLLKEWIEMKENISTKAGQAMWPPKKQQKPLPEGLTKKAAERIEKRRLHKELLRKRHTIVAIGEMYAAFLRTFIRVLAAGELSITAPTWKEFLTLKELPEGIKQLSAAFLLELSVSKDLFVQRFVANNIALFCITGENVEAIGEQGMDKLVSIAWVPDDEVQTSCVMAAYMVAKYPGFHGRPPREAAMNVLTELRDSDGSAKVKSVALTAYTAAAGVEAARDLQDLGENVKDKAKDAMGAVKGLFK